MCAIAARICERSFRNAKAWPSRRQAHCSHATQTGASFSAKPRTCSETDGQGKVAATRRHVMLAAVTDRLQAMNGGRS